MNMKNGAALSFKRQLLATGTITDAFISVLFAFVLTACWTACPTAYASNPTVWTLAWSDEFDGRNGSPVDSSKWSFMSAAAVGVTRNSRPIPAALQTHI